MNSKTNKNLNKTKNHTFENYLFINLHMAVKLNKKIPTKIILYAFDIYCSILV